MSKVLTGGGSALPTSADKKVMKNVDFNENHFSVSGAKPFAQFGEAFPSSGEKPINKAGGSIPAVNTNGRVKESKMG